MLPSALPAARIFGFGIDLSSRAVDAPLDFDSVAADIVSELTHSRSESRQRPIVFIGHGYGNLLIEKILSGERPESREIANLMGSTAAIMLFAAPLVGSTSLIEWTTKTLKVSRESKFFNSPILPQLWETFNQRTAIENISTVVFLERDAAGPHADGKEKEKAAAFIERLKEQKVNVVETKNDIGNIAKFYSPEDQGWQTTRHWICDAVQTYQLLEAAKDPEADMLNYLIEKSFNPNLVNRAGQTALQIAAKYQHLEAVKLLLSKGADIDHQDTLGMTALHTAVACNASQSVEIVQALLSSSANSGLRNLNNKTAKDLTYEMEGIRPAIREALETRPLMQGPSAPEYMVRGSPPRGNCTIACQKTGMVSREVFAASETSTDTHLPFYSTISEFIYGDRKVDEIFKALHGKRKLGDPLCRWHHIPINNVRKLVLVLLS